HTGDWESIAESLAQDDDVRQGVPVFEAQPLTGSTPTGEYLVGHEQDGLFIAVLAKLGKEIIGRHHRTGPTLNRFQNESRDVVDRSLIEVLVVEGDVLIGVHCTIRQGPDRPVGVRAGDHVHPGYPSRAVTLVADVGQRYGALRLSVEVVETTHQFISAGGGA